jgi:CRISPR-associated endonuclease/helicase Cas3
VKYRYLLAKSSDNPESPDPDATLLGHTKKVVESFKILFGSSMEEPTRLANQWMRFFRLDDGDFRIFFVNGAAACALHDIGKANNGFQDLVRGRRGFQAIWHEHLTGLLITLLGISQCFVDVPLLNGRMLLSAVIGHHLRAKSEDFAQPLNADIKRFQVFPEGILEILNHVASEFDGFQIHEIDVESVWGFDGRSGFDLCRLRDKIQRQTLRKFHLEMRENPASNRMLMAVRTALIIADSSGSAIARERKAINDWLPSAFGQTLSGEYVQRSVILPRVQEIKLKAGDNGFAWSDFQEAAENLSKRSLLIAPCGSGKTLAAWRWIKARLDEKPAARVIFLYPTRATAMEGFRDYISWAPEADASLITGTAAYDLQGMFSNNEDDRFGKDFSTEDRLYALGFWHRRIFSATVDQFLGFMQQVYRSVCLMPLLVDSVIVIDEVHSFDRSLFSALNSFLKNFDISVLCMTASLPPNRRKDLTEECGLELFPRDLTAFSDLEARAAMPRYRVHRLEGEEAAQEIALEAFEEGKRVLWVVNTVSRCQRLARCLGALCYHSRFRLKDRKELHNAVIEAFKNKREPVLALTTQVCEMSLDLDADVLISETAPMTSMIQRMGRCNRHARFLDERLGDVYFYQPEDQRPYEPDDLIGTEAFLEAVTENEVSQITLENLLEAFGPEDVQIERFAAFLENGPWAMAREQSLRDERDFTVNALLNTDLPDYFQLIQAKKPIDGLLIPVPQKFARQHPRLGRFPQIADSSHYHPDYGFFDHPLEEII